MIALKTGLALCLATLSIPAFATLGEPESSVTNDAVALKGSRSTIAAAKSRPAHRIQSDRVTVLQYPDASGKICAITWKGFGHPDLKTLLGSYYDTYRAAKAAQPSHRSGRQSAVKTSNLVVRLSGIPRRMTGLAYLPGKCPAGIDPENLE